MALSLMARLHVRRTLRSPCSGMATQRQAVAPPTTTWLQGVNSEVAWQHAEGNSPTAKLKTH
eukprot:699106-Amphidinium_carterae.1